MKFREKPVVIEAIQFLGSDQQIADFMGTDLDSMLYVVGKGLAIETHEGTKYATWGDWIIKGITGEFYPCRPDIFEATYERVEE